MPTKETQRPALARRIARRATDLIAISIVSVGVLAVSGRLSEWWSTDADPVASPETAASQIAGAGLRWGAGDSPVTLLAGDNPVRIERRIISGDQDQVDRLLQKRLVEIASEPATGPDQRLSREDAPRDGSLDNDSLPDGSPSVDSNGTESTGRASPRGDSAGQEPGLRTANDDPWQSRIDHVLSLLADVPPIDSKPGHWSLYRLDAEDSLFAGSCLVATRPSAAETNQQRLAAWALAVPSDSYRWTSFIMAPSSKSVSSKGAADEASIAIPQDAETVLSIGSPEGTQLTVFRETSSAGGLRKWAGEINSLLQEAGWQQVRGWQQSSSRATARFEQPLADAGNTAIEPGGTREARRSRLAIEYALAVDGHGRRKGLASVMAIPSR